MPAGDGKRFIERSYAYSTLQKAAEIVDMLLERLKKLYQWSMSHIVLVMIRVVTAYP